MLGDSSESVPNGVSTTYNGSDEPHSGRFGVRAYLESWMAG